VTRSQPDTPETHAVTGESVSLDGGLMWYRFENGAIVKRSVASGTCKTIQAIVEP
jgi:hypothetical protein